MRIFLDANILFSAAKAHGAVRRLVEMLIKARHECCADGFVLEEARRNLAAKAPEGLVVLDSLVARIEVARAQSFDAALDAALPLPLPDQDRPVLAAAIRLGCAALVTGDRTHFGPLYGKSFRGVAIHSPRSLAQALLR
ncbi:MAG: PIN domain-containing protein [Betaproteobacteria bacterium]|nr:PIN domain-containing protein [Betaproteobacteria bacterium]